MSSIGQQTTTADLEAVPGLPAAHLDHAAPGVYRALLAAGKEANSAAAAAIIINAFNRVAITSHDDVAPEHRSVS